MINPFLWVRSSIRRKAIISLLLLLLSAIFLIGLSIVSWSRHFVVDETKRMAASTSRFVVNDISGMVDEGSDLKEISDVVGRVCSDPKVLYALLLGEDGKVLVSSCTEVKPDKSNALPLSELYSIEPESTRFHIYNDVLEVYRPISRPVKGSRLFFLMGFNIAEVHTIISKVTRLIAINGFIVYLFGLMILLTAVNRLAGPLANLTEGIKDVGSGKFPSPMAVEGHDEIASLSSAFNKMIEDLNNSTREIEEYQLHLEEMVEERTSALNRANTELVDINKSLQAANEKLMELDKLKSNFLGIATHELKTPLAVVEGYLESLENGFAGGLSEDQQGVIQQTLSSCYRMDDLISDMLDLTKIEAGKLPMDRQHHTFIHVVEKVAHQMAPMAAKRGVSLDVKSDGLETEVCFDQERISQVLVNLIGNAIKFTPEGGKVTVFGEIVETHRGEAISISVQDTGIGISGQDISHVFEEFAQVGSPGKEEGTGLGLAICKRIVEAHGGSISAESTPDEGSVFTFTLPVEV
ncbi:MAG: ATP-binding protein [bacterium]